MIEAFIASRKFEYHTTTGMICGGSRQALLNCSVGDTLPPIWHLPLIAIDRTNVTGITDESLTLRQSV
jgi:hypothetical protein